VVLFPDAQRLLDVIDLGVTDEDTDNIAEEAVDHLDAEVDLSSDHTLQLSVGAARGREYRGGASCPTGFRCCS
jgi:hypothetical protein